MKNTHQLTSQDCLRDLVGLPYRTFDCWELVKFFYKKAFSYDLGGVDIEYSDPTNNVEISTVLEIGKNKFTEVTTPEYGDVMLLRVYGYASHLGIYLDNRKFLHTTAATGSVLADTDVWKNKIEGYYRYDRR